MDTFIEGSSKLRSTGRLDFKKKLAPQAGEPFCICLGDFYDEIK